LRKTLYFRPFISLFLIFSFLLIGASPVFALNMKFSDMAEPQFSWAVPYVEKMSLMGIVKGKSETIYAPNDPVKRDEIITMLVRLMGLEEQTEGKILPASFSKPYSVPNWAKPYVAMAIEKGLITGQDLEDFRAEDDAKRYEVAIFAVRAMGLENEAQSRKNVNLSFTDTYSIPLDARAYVEICVEKGIINGFPDKSFKPNDKITRAQAAKVLFTVAKYLPPYNFITGTVEEVDSTLLPSVTVKLENGGLETYTVDNKTSIYKEDESGALSSISLSGIKVKDKVNIIPDGTKKALYLEIVSSQTTPGVEEPEIQGTMIEGTIKDVDSNQKIITVSKKSGQDTILSIQNQTKIYIDGISASWSDLAVGQPIKLWVSGTQVTRIEVQNIDREVTGILRTIIPASNLLVIENEKNDEKESYMISPNVKVTKDDKRADIYDLRSGDMAEIIIAGSKVVEITAESAEKEIEGIIKSISFLSAKPRLTIETDDGDEEIIELAKNVKIKKNKKSADVNDLKVGDKITALLEYNEVTQITAQSVKKDVRGWIKALSIADVTSITIKEDNGEENTYFITSDTEIMKDRKVIPVYDLRLDYYVDMEVEGNEVLEMDVTAREVQLTFQGVVQYIHSNANVIVISEKGADGVTRDRQINYTTGTEIRKNGKSTSIKKVEEGDEIIAIGRYDRGIFYSDIIIVLTITE